MDFFFFYRIEGNPCCYYLFYLFFVEVQNSLEPKVKFVLHMLFDRNTMNSSSFCIFNF
jgi:hypothetical protein